MRRPCRRRFRPTVHGLEARQLLSTLPAGFTEESVATGLSFPTAMEVADNGHVYIAEKGGTLRVVREDGLRVDPALTVTVNSEGERGLIGFALDQAKDGDGTPIGAFVYYTATEPTVHNRLSYFGFTKGVAEPGSERILLDLDPAAASNHNGGSVVIGLDDRIYLGVGEHGTPANSQSLDNLFGKVLRLAKDGSIPEDNPFFTTNQGVNRAIWAYGLRNPFGMELENSTGRLFINDAGTDAFEEVNVGQAGGNYGWPLAEGPTRDSRFVSPFFSYTQEDGVSSVIVGGAVYEPATRSFPADYAGDLFVADFSGGVRAVDLATGEARPFLTDTESFLTDLATAADGSLYVLNYGLRGNPSGTGSLSQVTFTPIDSTPTPGASEPTTDFDGDGSADVAVYRPTNGRWYVSYSGGGAIDFSFDTPVFGEPVPGDYDGDGVTDFAVFQRQNPTLPGTALWTVRLSSTGQTISQAFGAEGIDSPVPADYDGDGKTDIAVHRFSTAEWFILGSKEGGRRAEFGFANVDLPVAADYDGDGRADLGVFRPNSDLLPGAAHWFVSLSGGGVLVRLFGEANADVPLPGDYDGDDKADIAVYRPGTGETFVLGSRGVGQRLASPAPVSPESLPIAQDFDGDGLVDPAVFDFATARFSIARTRLGLFTLDFGQAGVDVPVQRPLARTNLARIRAIRGG